MSKVFTGQTVTFQALASTPEFPESAPYQVATIFSSVL